MKKFLLFFSWGLLALMLSGCGKAEEKGEQVQSEENAETVQSTEQPYDFLEAYSNTMENVTFTTEIIVNDGVREKGLYSTKAYLQKLDAEKAFEKLFGESEVIEQREFDLEGGKERYYRGSNGESLSTRPNGLFMMKPLFIHALNTFSLEGEDYNGDLYLTGEEFEFMGIEEAYETLKKEISEFGLDIEGQYHCYSLNYKTMEENEYAMGHDGKEDPSVYKDEWTAEDNGYFFAIHQEVQDCVVQYPVADAFFKISDANAPIQIFYTKNGIEHLDISNIFTFEESDEQLYLKSFDEIAAAIAKKYNMLLTESEYEVTKAELFWRPVETEEEYYEMLPAWEVTVLEKAAQRTFEMYINAVTAEEIV